MGSMDDAHEGVAEGWNKAKHVMDDAADTAKDTAEDVAAFAKDKANDVGDFVKDKASDAKEFAEEKLHGHDDHDAAEEEEPPSAM